MNVSCEKNQFSSFVMFTLVKTWLAFLENKYFLFLLSFLKFALMVFLLLVHYPQDLTKKMMVRSTDDVTFLMSKHLNQQQFQQLFLQLCFIYNTKPPPRPPKGFICLVRASFVVVDWFRFWTPDKAFPPDLIWGTLLLDIVTAKSWFLCVSGSPKSIASKYSVVLLSPRVALMFKLYMFHKYCNLGFRKASVKLNIRAICCCRISTKWFLC